ncbi:MAG: LysM peptidoglycan-binding domain-containing protein, partial [Deltaproteobacteria bacterium]|nr:LysM peptidoglycan-binding domain-containing protein [Deltaproteobacteria bacterium]
EPAPPEHLGLLTPLDPSQEAPLGWLDSPWAPALDSSATFVQAARLRSTRGRPKVSGHPCLFVGELRNDTCISFNWGSAGFIKNPVALKSGARYKTREHSSPSLARNWAMPEMIEAITMAVDAVHAAYPDTKRLVIGDLSRREGGHFPPHVSHQSGRDADIGYYTKGPGQPDHLQRIGAAHLDVERTWVFLRSMLKNDQAQMIFMDYRLQKPLFYYMRDVVKLPPHLLRRYISYPRRGGGVIRHLKGHADHLHIRFYAPYSIAAGEAYLRKHGTAALKPIPVYHAIRRGDNLLKIAKRHRVTWRKIMQWNRLNRHTARRLRVGQRIMVGYRTPKLP